MRVTKQGNRAILTAALKRVLTEMEGDVRAMVDPPAPASVDGVAVDPAEALALARDLSDQFGVADLSATG